MSKTISNQAIFGEYKNPEDKVTAALLHILHYGGHKIVCSVFDDIDLPSNDINVYPQVTEDESRPDGFVSCDCKYKIYIESKITRNALNTGQGKKQLNANKKLSSPNDAQWVIYITPDEIIPKELDGVSEIIWINWQTVVERLKGYETTDTLVKFLIDQFCVYVDHLVFQNRGTVYENGILISGNDASDADQRVIIVGGHWGEEIAVNYHFYACQAERYFLSAKYIAFYHQNRIKNLFEIIGTPEESVALSTKNDPDVQKYIKEMNPNDINENRKLFRLKHIKTFDPVINNNIMDKNGKKCAFTYNQRYTTYDKITKAKTTSDLIN